jgi:glycosyltransferase involved in cell wall biosynthesis
MPNFNNERFIATAIESVLGQTFANLELIVVDDASTDASVRIAQTYSEQDGRVRLIQKSQREGSAAARNRGILGARGSEICFLDSDDVYSPLKLASQLQELRKEGQPVVVYCGWWRMDEAGKTLSAGKRDHPRSSGRIFSDALTQTFGMVSMCMIPRACFDRVGLFDESLIWAEDYDLLLRLAREFDFRYIDQALYGYRSHDTSKRKVLGRRDRLLCESLVTERHFRTGKELLDNEAKKQVISNLIRYYSLTGQNRKMLRYGITTPRGFARMLSLTLQHERID